MVEVDSIVFEDMAVDLNSFICKRPFFAKQIPFSGQVVAD
jgi:hypothetical protein